jgi:hypothetical protein
VAGNLAAPKNAASDFKPVLATASGDGQLAAALGDGELVVWSLQDGQILAEIGGLPKTQHLQFLKRPYLLADGCLIDVDRKKIVRQVELGDGVQPWEVVRGNADGRLWLAVRHPGSPDDYLLAELDRPDHLLEGPPEAATDSPQTAPGKTILTPAVLLR